MNELDCLCPHREGVKMVDMEPICEPECSDPRQEDGCPWEDHEHDPSEFHVVDGEWRRRRDRPTADRTMTE